MIKIDWTLWLQFANFFVLMLVLNALLYRPLRDMLNRRRETIDGSYQKAKDLEGTINEKMASYEEKLQEARQKGSQEKAVLRKAAQEEEAEILREKLQEAGIQLSSFSSEPADKTENFGELDKKDVIDIII